jgi:tetratricopeptide (TPR) repeat protein
MQNTRKSCHSARIATVGIMVFFSMLWLGLPSLRSFGLAPLQSETTSTGTTDSAQQDDPLQQEIASWIRKLGAESYSTRLQAQSELERIGVRALDQLHQASFDPDPQIASQARYLVQSNQFNWAWESDPPRVRRILTLYTAAALHEKTGFINQLNQLENDEGLNALCRLVRYETQGCLAKLAALHVMRGKPNVGQTVTERRELVASLLDGSRSSASRWVLEQTAKPQEFQLDRWLDIINRESNLLQSKSMETSVEILNELRQWVVQQIPKTDANRSPALDLARTIPESFKSMGVQREQQLLEFAQWALTVNLPELVQEQHESLRSALQDPRFGYLLAESWIQQGNADLAQKVAERTSDRISVTSRGEPAIQDKDPKNQLNPQLEILFARNASQAFERSTLAEYLIRRGQFPWAETELRKALKDQEDAAELATIINLTQLSQLLHELERDDEAAASIEKFAKRFENEPLFRTQVSEQSGDSLVSNYYLFQGNDYARKEQPEKARECFLKAIELSQENVDAIIGMYRLPETDEQKDQRKTLQKQITISLRSEIDARERELKRDNPRALATEQRALANQMNTLAWLMTNTEGNLDEALFFSRKACSMENRAAYLDTLAHCYASLKRYREAADQQRRAVALDPFQPSLQKALALFEAKATEQQEIPQ